MFSSDPKSPLVRIVAALAGLAVLGWGLASILQRGDLHYRNWFGELIFSPFAILFGLGLILSALFKPEILGRQATTRKR
jgi:drug/metabolite transporter (DMT)-like permease